MRILIYSDVHGNLPAFEEMLQKEGVCDGYICLGDLVNYGPWSNECVDLAVSLPNSVLLMGNHEEIFTTRYIQEDNSLIKLFFDFTIKSFTKFNEINRFLPYYKVGNFICIHTIQNRYIYSDIDIELSNNYIIGHSHHQFRYSNNGFEVYNAGSVGQNRKYINVANYLIYNIETRIIEMKFMKFDIDRVLSKMETLDYPEDCIKYYRNKKKLL